MEHRHEQDGYWLIKIYQTPERWISDDILRVAKVTFDRDDIGVIIKQRVSMCYYQRIIVNIGNAGLGRDLMGDRMYITSRRQASSDIHNLPDSGVSHKKFHNPAKKLPVIPCRDCRIWHRFEQTFR